MLRLLAIGLIAAPFLSAQAPGVIRVLGNSHMDKLMSVWEEGFRRHQPEVRFENTYLGTANAIAGLVPAWQVLRPSAVASGAARSKKPLARLIVARRAIMEFSKEKGAANAAPSLS